MSSTAACCRSLAMSTKGVGHAVKAERVELIRGRTANRAIGDGRAFCTRRRWQLLTLVGLLFPRMS